MCTQSEQRFPGEFDFVRWGEYRRRRAQERNEIGGHFEAFLDAMASATLRRRSNASSRTDLSNTFIRSTIDTDRRTKREEDGRIHADDVESCDRVGVFERRVAARIRMRRVR